MASHDEATTEPSQTPRDGTFSRRRVLRHAGLAIGGATFGGALLGVPAQQATSASSFSRNIEILNFALLVEEAQAGLYEAAVRQGRLSADLRRFAQQAGADERAHVTLLRRLLRGRVRKERLRRLRFDARTWSDQTLTEAAGALEHAATSTYIGQGANLTPDFVIPLARITAVDARHAAWIAAITGANPAPRAQDAAETPEKTLATLRRIGLLTS
jgi:Ferritin-like domain